MIPTVIAAGCIFGFWAGLRHQPRSAVAGLVLMMVLWPIALWVDDVAPSSGWFPWVIGAAFLAGANYGAGVLFGVAVVGSVRWVKNLLAPNRRSERTADTPPRADRAA